MHIVICGAAENKSLHAERVFKRFSFWRERALIYFYSHLAVRYFVGIVNRRKNENFQHERPNKKRTWAYQPKPETIGHFRGGSLRRRSRRYESRQNGTMAEAQP